MEVWILITSLFYIAPEASSASQLSVEFNGEMACKNALELFRENVPHGTVVDAFCVKKDNPPVQGPHMPLNCNGIVCQREMPK